MGRCLNKRDIIRFSVDIILTVVLLCVVANFFNIFEYRVKRGFFCNDDSLKYPVAPNTLGSKQMLYVLCIYVPCVVIVFCEGFLYLLNRSRTTTVKDKNVSSTCLAVWNLHYNLTSFLCGLALNALFVHVAKITLSRLRPHFFAVCQPYRLLDGSTCDNPKNHGIYIEDYECHGKNDPAITPKMIHDVFLSFPSGHASYMFYGIIFMVFYLQRFAKSLRQYEINVDFFMMVIQMLYVLLAWFVTVSRVTDYKHHWSDVLVGIVQGTLAAIAVTMFVCQQLRNSNKLRECNCLPEGVKTLSSNTATIYNATAAATMPNAILVA